MLNRIKESLGKIQYKMLLSLLVLGLCPTLYTTLRIFFLGQMPDAWAFSIAGQLGWVNLLYEIVQEAIILPLFYFIGQVVTNREELTNRVRSGLVVTGGVYLVFSLLLIGCADPLVRWMGVNAEIHVQSVVYIRLESIATIFTMLANFALVVLVTMRLDRYVYWVTGARLALSVICDTFLVSGLPVSANLGVNGIAISNILVSAILLVVSLCLLSRQGVHVFCLRQKMSFGWMKEFTRIGAISGLESFVRNIAYMLMIVRMVNVVNEQGTYWVANNFIWGWLLLPITQLGELIKADVATDAKAIRENTPAYLILTTAFVAVWLIGMPLWKPFMTHVLQFDEVDKLFRLCAILVGFYVLYAYQNVFDATFYGLGKTNYMLFESVVTNAVYYGIAFVLYLTGAWTPTLDGIALLFGLGVAFDSIVSCGAYLYLLRGKRSELAAYLRDGSEKDSDANEVAAI